VPHPLITSASLAVAKRRGAAVSVARVRLHARAPSFPRSSFTRHGDLGSARSGDGRGSVPINVAVADTGIDLDHPDPERRRREELRRGMWRGSSARRTTTRASSALRPGRGCGPCGATSGIGQGSTATALCGVDFVTSTRTDSDATNNIAVANMSLGFFGPKSGDDGNCGMTNHDALHLAICNSVVAGITWVVSAGNAGTDYQSQIPASYNEVLSVTAMADFNGQPGGGASSPCGFSTDDAVAGFSNFATLASDKAHTIAAPGVCILSTATAP
jgi:subtilisin